MKRVTATEARKHWFRLLDEAAEGTPIVIDRGGIRIVLRREPLSEEKESGVPSYHSLISAPDVSRADRWGWRWTGEEGEIELEEVGE